MSKKSRKRNRKILKALAVGLGAAALMRGRRNKAIDAGIASAEADKGSDMLPESKNWITKKNVTAPVKVADTGSNTGSGFQTRFTAKGADGKWRGPMEHKRYMDSTAGNLVPPSMRGGAETAQGFVRKVPIARGRGPGSVQYGWTTNPYKKGGRVKLAKRGLGRAFTKSKK